MESDADKDIDTNKVDEAALALLYLTMHGDKRGVRAWKSIDWGVMDRLYEKGYIFDPKNKAKSVVVTAEGEEKAEALYYRLFGVQK